MSVDLSKVEIEDQRTDGDFPVVPNGTWLAVVSADEVESKAGNPMMKCQFKTEKGVVFDMFVFSNEHGLKRLKILAKACGVTDYSEVNANDLHGKSIMITTEEKFDDYTQKIQAKITYGGFKAVEDATPDPMDF